MPQTLFNALAQDDDFLRELGRLLLAASQFETRLRQYATARSETEPSEKATLGPLVKRIRESTYLSRTLDEHMMFSISQRNYFVHNLYDRIQGYTTDDLSVDQFRARLNGLVADIKLFSEIIEREIPENA
jgi:hypothetical protein